MNDRSEERFVLEEFLSCALNTPDEVFDKFSALGSAIRRGEPNSASSFVYVPGTRKDRVLLVAHADTVFFKLGRQIVVTDENNKGLIYHGILPGAGLGADDRAGCAILYLLRDMGHSLLILGGEEQGCRGAILTSLDVQLFGELNSHQYMLEFDRSGCSDYKVYNIPVTDEFKKFIEVSTGYTEPDKSKDTDICRLCRAICGANLSVGYYREHTEDEYLQYDEWLHTLRITREMLAGEQKKFPLSR